MGNYRSKWWEIDDSEVVPIRKYSPEEDRAFIRGRKYERRKLIRIALWCAAGLIITAWVIRFLDGCVIIIPMR